MLDVVASNAQIPGFSAMRVVRLFRLARVLRLLSIAKIHRKKAMDAASFWNGLRGAELEFLGLEDP